MTLASVSTHISNVQLATVSSLKDFQDWTIDTISHEFASVVKSKLELENVDNPEMNGIDLRASVVILSPKEYDEMKAEINRLQWGIFG